MSLMYLCKAQCMSVLKQGCKNLWMPNYRSMVIMSSTKVYVLCASSLFLLLHVTTHCETHFFTIKILRQEKKDLNFNVHFKDNW